MTQPATPPPKPLPGKAATYFWVVLSLLSSMICLLLAPNPSPLVDRMYRLNFHVLHISWPTFTLLLSGLGLLMPFLVLVGGTVGFWRSRRMRFRNVPRLFIVASLAIALFAGWNWYSEHSAFDGGYTWCFVDRYNTLRAEREICQIAEYHAANYDGHWPPHLAALIDEGINPERLLYGFSKTPALPETVLDVEPNRWPTIAAEFDAHCDFAYLGGDLTISPSLQAESSRIVVLYGKIDLPEIPQVIYDSDRQVYEYPFAARPVAFADGHARFVPLEEMPQLFAEHNAARARLGLPTQQINP